MEKVVALAPAKLNLSLDVVCLLPNGYHALDMVMQTITLYDRVEVQKAEQLTLTLPGSSLQADESNTALRAAMLFFEAASLEPKAALTVHKAIPAQAGMAGGSADAAGVLVALNRLCGEPLSFCRLLELGNRVGADVPFSLQGGTCRVKGTGDFLKALPPCPDCHFVILMPEEGISTPAAFARYDEIGSNVHPDTDALETAIRNQNLLDLCHAAKNALQPCAGTSQTDIFCEALYRQGALTALMTGSGAAVFGIFAGEQTAQDAARHLSGLCRQIYTAVPEAFGARIAEKGGENSHT